MLRMQSLPLVLHSTSLDPSPSGHVLTRAILSVCRHFDSCLAVQDEDETIQSFVQSYKSAKNKKGRKRGRSDGRHNEDRTLDRGDKVAAKLNDDDPWILASIIKYIPQKDKYQVSPCRQLLPPIALAEEFLCDCVGRSRTKTPATRARGTAGATAVGTPSTPRASSRCRRRTRPTATCSRRWIG